MSTPLLELLAALSAIVVIAIGRAITRHAEVFTSLLRRLLGDGAFPSNGRKARFNLAFFRWFGHFVTVAGTLALGLLAIRALLLMFFPEMVDA